MGQIGKKILETINYSDTKLELVNLQVLSMKEIDSIFVEDEIQNIQCEADYGIGERGYYEGKDNLLVKVSFRYFRDFCFEFYLYYDQLEYYVFTNSKILKKCNLEDFTEDEKEMTSVFIKYLKKDLNKLKIPYNNFTR